MKPRTMIINNRIVNCVEQLACYLKQGDIFRKPRGSTNYKFEKLMLEHKLVLCENMETHTEAEIYSNSPVLRLLVI